MGEFTVPVCLWPGRQWGKKKLQWRKISSEIKRSKDNSKFQSNSSKPEKLNLQETQGKTGQK